MATLTSANEPPSLVHNPLFYVFLGAVFSFTTVIGSMFSASLLLPLVITAVIAGTVLLFESPILLLSALLVLRMSLDYSSQFVSVNISSFTLTFSQLLGLGIAALGLLVLVVYRERLTRFPLILPFGIFFAYGLFTLLYTVSPRTSLQELLRVFDLFVLDFFAYAAVKDEADYRTLFRAIFVSALVPIAFGLYQYLFGIGLSDITVSIPRIFGTFSHPNVFSLFLFAVAALTLIFFSTFAKTTAEKRFLLFFLAGISFILILTFARVAWIVLFLFFLAIAAVRFRVMLVPLVALPLMLFLIFAPFQDRVLESLQRDPDSSLLWRQTLWHDVTTESLANGRVVFGSGLDTFHLVAENLRGVRLGPNEAHNDFVKFFVEGGAIGLVVLLAYLGSIMLILYRGYKKAPSMRLRTLFGFLLIFFLVLQVAALTDNVFKNTPVQWLFFVATGGALALARKRE